MKHRYLGRSTALFGASLISIALASGTALAQDPKGPDKLPDGWKEYSPADKVFTVWIPAGGSCRTYST